MWKIKELKAKAKVVVKKNYWTAIVVCFLLAMLTGEFGTSVIGWLQGDDTLDPTYIVKMEEQNEEVDQEKVQIILEKVTEVEEKVGKENLTDLQIKIIEMVKANINGATKSQKYIFKIWDAITSFNINRAFLGVTLSLTAVISLLFVIMIGDPLIVASRKYFLKAREEDAKITDIAKDIFKKDSWINVAIIMFLRNIYNMLWYLTIIGGVIKMYEYRMIPYILAENPKIERKKAFILSKEMMQKNKWKAFLLDLSFIGWEIASIFTFGMLNILYANPYKAATSTELYIVLRDKVIADKCEYYEEINNIKK